MAEVRSPEAPPVVPEGPVAVYRLRPPRADERALRSLARQFGLTGTERQGAFRRDAHGLSYEQGPQVVRLHAASGGARYYDRQRWQVDDGEANLELSDRQAIGAAERFLRDRKLVPAGEQRVLRVSRLNVATAELEHETVEQRVIDAGVAFQRVVDGIPVDGPGGKLVLYLDQKRQVTGFDRLWRDLGAAAKRVELRRPEDVLAQLERRWGRDRDGIVQVVEFRFGYFELGWDTRQELLQPAYIALLTLVSPDEQVRINKVEVIPASPQATAGLIPPRKRRPPPIPPRRD
ncbi:MAG: hypothetical protein ACXVY8_06475 [Gaiellaceae bacterium]